MAEVNKYISFDFFFFNFVHERNVVDGCGSNLGFLSRRKILA
jgi:hypothetical protein